MSKLEVIKVFASRIEAELARGYLETMEVKTRVISDDADQLYPSLGAIKGVRLVTDEKNLEQARALLENKGESL